MSIPSASIRAWTRRLLVLEAENRSASDTHVNDAARVSEMLRISLAQFVGADGFTALLRRALVLARADVPSLEDIKITKNGQLEGMEDFVGDRGAEAAMAITSHLLALLVTFIGEPLAFRLVSNGLPDPSDRTIPKSEEPNEHRTT